VKVQGYKFYVFFEFAKNKRGRPEAVLIWPMQVAGKVPHEEIERMLIRDTQRLAKKIGINIRTVPCKPGDAQIISEEARRNRKPIPPN